MLPTLSNLVVALFCYEGVDWPSRIILWNYLRLGKTTKYLVHKSSLIIPPQNFSSVAVCEFCLRGSFTVTFCAALKASLQYAGPETILFFHCQLLFFKCPLSQCCGGTGCSKHSILFLQTGGQRSFNKAQGLVSKSGSPIFINKIK